MISRLRRNVRLPVSTEKYALGLCFVPVAPVFELFWFWRRWRRLAFSFFPCAAILLLIYMAFSPLFVLASFAFTDFPIGFFLAVYLMQTVTALIWRMVEYRRLTKEIEQYKAAAIPS